MHLNYGMHKEKSDSFFESPALSFRSQEDLHSLFDLLLDTEAGFTLVVGAGVSLDAGLPSWGQLIANMVNSSQFEDRWREAAVLDDADLIRKAETVLQMILAKRASTRSQIVRDALYTDRGGNDRPITPGRLADAIARFFLMLKQMGKAVGLVTTNYDTVLETAINGYEIAKDPEGTGEGDTFIVSPHVLADSKAEDGDDDSWDPGSSVMHLHGLLPPGDEARGKLVLTESDFLSVGPRVKQFLLARMRKTVTIFIGVSLTDPNLVGPLWQRQEDDNDSGERTFVLSVCTSRNASAHNGIDPDTAEAYEIKKVEALARVLPVTPILLKSYGQQIQLMNELAYVLQLQQDEREEAYMDDDEPSTSERYGHRLTRVLEAAYTNINCSPDEDFPSGDHAKTLSDRLFAPLDEDQDGELAKLLKEARFELRDSHSLHERRIFREFHQAFEDERFGIFLWLRSRTNSGAFRADYSLRLVGTSVYQHRHEWSLDRTAPVRAGSRFPAARAEFNGTFALQDDEKDSDWQLWRSILAVPISCNITDIERGGETTSRLLADVPIGVITLNSRLLATRSVWQRDDPRSILSAMYAPTFDRLTALLHAVAIAAISSEQP